MKTKTVTALAILFFFAASVWAEPEMRAYDKDVPLTEALHRGNELFPDSKPVTEQEVIAAVKAIKVINPDMPDEVYQTYMRIVQDKVFPKGMFFRRITTYRITTYGTPSESLQVDWLDLCLMGHPAADQKGAEKKDIVFTTPGGSFGTISGGGLVKWEGGFAYRLRSRFISSE